MDKTMTPSTMTNRQIERAVELFRAQLRKGATRLSSEAVQKAFGRWELGHELFAVLQKRAEAWTCLLTRFVTVYRGLSPERMLDTTSLKQYVDPDVVSNMPRGEGDGVEIEFFGLEYSATDDDVQREYELRGLAPCDPYSLCALILQDRTFAQTYTIVTHWKDEDGRWCWMSLPHLPIGGSRAVYVRRRCGEFGGGNWTNSLGSLVFAGIRKNKKVA